MMYFIQVHTAIKSLPTAKEPQSVTLETRYTK